MNTMTDDIREAVRIELARRNWNRSKLADEAGVSRQFISEMLNGNAANIAPSWQRVLDTLELELRVVPKEKGRW